MKVGQRVAFDALTAIDMDFAMDMDFGIDAFGVIVVAKIADIPVVANWDAVGEIAVQAARDMFVELVGHVALRYAFAVEAIVARTAFAVFAAFAVLVADAV